MEYSFDIEYAQAYGVAEAIMIKNFQYWIIKNKANGTNLYDGKTWTFNSVKSYTSIFPFWNKNQVERILVSLRKQEVLTTGNYNKAKYDRTRWYAFIDEKRFIDKNNSISAKQEMQSKKTINAIPQKQVTIPNSKTTYNKPKDNNPYYTELLFVYEGDDSLEAVKNAFSYILSNWSSLEPFLQKQIKLSQINSNLANIINQLKNGTERKSNSSSLAAEILAKYS